MAAVRKHWLLAPQDTLTAAHLARTMNIPPVVAQLLVNRGICSPAEGRSFLDSPMNALHPPRLLPGVEQAAALLSQAVQAEQRICIYGDYDVDGTTGTAILYRMMKLVGAQVQFYVPNRMTEGYGLNAEAIRELAGEGVQWLISVDCGITAVEEISLAASLGMRTIVTDHHELGPTLPPADVLVHPRLPGSAYPSCAQICGAGVAFKLAWALAQVASGSDKVQEHFRECLLDSLCLAALGTVADVMPLLDENRIFVKHGLARLRAQPLIGLQALCAAAGLKEDEPIRAEDIAFKLAPRLNAAGRLECARLVVELLTTPNRIRARELADYLEDLNAQRQSVERKATAQAKEMVALHGWDADAALVLSSTEWHQGVVGIVASRLVDHFGKPTLVIAERDDATISTGSGRSMTGLPLHTALASCAGCLEGFGGHAAAAGFKIRTEQIPTLRTEFNHYVRTHFSGTPPAPTLKIEAEVPLMALSANLLRDLERLEPYGTGNTRPRFLASDLRIEGSPRRMGQGERHLSFRVKQDQTMLRAVAFGFGERLEELMSEQGVCSLVFVPKLNEWQGQRNVELEVIDFQPGAQPEINQPGVSA